MSTWADNLSLQAEAGNTVHNIMFFSEEFDMKIIKFLIIFRIEAIKFIRFYT